MGDSPEEIKTKYRSQLADLKINSKPIINLLTMMAEDYIKQAPLIVQIIENHLARVQPEIKLPTLYLIDSIIKNVKKDYVQLFTQNIVSTFCGVFEKADEETRILLWKLRGTWNLHFPQKKLCAIDIRCNQADPKWPVQAVPSVPGSIHVNPRFLKPKPQVPATTSLDLSPTEVQMRAQLLAKQKELLELQTKKVELELMQTKLQIEEKARQQQQGTVKTEVGSTVPVGSLKPVRAEEKRHEDKKSHHRHREKDKEARVEEKVRQPPPQVTVKAQASSKDSPAEQSKTTRSEEKRHDQDKKSHHRHREKDKEIRVEEKQRQQHQEGPSKVLTISKDVVEQFKSRRSDEKKHGTDKKSHHRHRDKDKEARSDRSKDKDKEKIKTREKNKKSPLEIEKTGPVSPVKKLKTATHNGFDDLFGPKDVDLRGATINTVKSEDVVTIPRFPVTITSPVSVSEPANVCDPLGRPLIYNRLPNDPQERKRSLDSRASSIDAVEQFKSMHVDRALRGTGILSDNDMKAICLKAKEEHDHGLLNGDQYVAVMKEIVQIGQNSMKKAHHIQPSGNAWQSNNTPNPWVTGPDNIWNNGFGPAAPPAMGTNDFAARFPGVAWENPKATPWITQGLPPAGPAPPAGPNPFEEAITRPPVYWGRSYPTGGRDGSGSRGSAARGYTRGRGMGRGRRDNPHDPRQGPNPWAVEPVPESSTSNANPLEVINSLFQPPSAVMEPMEEDKVSEEKPAEPAVNLNVSDLVANLIKVGLLPPTSATTSDSQTTEEVDDKVAEEAKESSHDSNDQEQEEEQEEVTVSQKPLFPPLPTVDVSFEDNLKERREIAIGQIWTGVQCSQCGLRFPPDQTIRYSQHLDWHFRQNRREKANARKALSRKWYYDMSDWIQFEEIEDLEERAASLFENMEEEVNPESRSPAALKPEDFTVLASAHEGAVCPQCGEGFDSYYDEEHEEWRLKNAKLNKDDGDETLYHPICHQDYIRSLVEKEDEVGSEKEEEAVTEKEEETVSEKDQEMETEEATTTTAAVTEDNEKEDVGGSDNKENEDQVEEEVLIISEGKKEKLVIEIDIEDDDEKNSNNIVNNESKTDENVTKRIIYKPMKFDIPPIKLEPRDEELVEEESDFHFQPFLASGNSGDSEPMNIDLTEEDSMHARLVTNIDGNLQHEDSTVLPFIPTPKIRINLSGVVNSVPSVTLKEKADSPSSKPEETGSADSPSNKEDSVSAVAVSQDPASPSSPVDPVLTEEMMRLKPRLVGKKLQNCPPKFKGTEESGLCVIC